MQKSTVCYRCTAVNQTADSLIRRKKTSDAKFAFIRFVCHSS